MDGDSAEPLLSRAVGGPAGLRTLLERLGPTWVKCGQYLALRPDVIPQAYCDELMHLVDDVPPFPWEHAEAIMADELGGDPAKLFAALDPSPVAAGSLAQTHRAQLADGTEVAVKVQRPGVRRRVARDLARADVLVKALELARVPLAISPRELVDELRGWMQQELDLERELRNMERLHELARSRELMHVPVPFRRLSSARVLTAEFVRGVPFSDLLRALRSGRSLAPLRRRLDLDLDRLAENLLFACLTQIFRFRFFHADVHPGNLIALPGNTIGFVDFGLCDDLDDAVRERQARFLAALYEGDVARMYDTLTEILEAPEDTALLGFRADFAIETRARLADGNEAPVAEWMVAVLRIARAHGLRLPPRVLSLYRALLAAETVADTLGGEADLRSVGREFFERERLQDVLGRLGRAEAEALAVNLGTLLRDGPGQIHQTLCEFEAGRFALPVDAARAPRAIAAQRRRERLVAGAALSAALAMLLARGHVVAAPVVVVALLVTYGFVALGWWRLR